MLLPVLGSAQVLKLEVGASASTVRTAYLQDAQGFDWVQETDHMWVFRNRTKTTLTELVFELEADKVIGIYFAHQIDAKASVSINFFRDFVLACEQDPVWTENEGRSQFYAGMLPEGSLLRTFVARDSEQEQVLYAFEQDGRYVQGRWKILNQLPSP
jgi:hypothetical protein